MGARVLAVKLLEGMVRVWDHSFCCVLDVVYPETCRVCGQWLLGNRDRTLGLRALCCQCWRSMAQEACWVEWVSSPAGDSFKIVSRTEYCGVVKKLVYKLKYDGDQLLAYDLARLLRSGWFALRQEECDNRVVVVPVPLHAERKYTRGFNQAELLAQDVAQTAGACLDVKSLIRVKRTAPQHGLTRADRRDNLTGAFQGDPKRLAGCEVVLVDDVYTSGATLIEAAQTVLACGAKSVSALTLARAVLGRKRPDLP